MDQASHDAPSLPSTGAGSGDGPYLSRPRRWRPRPPGRDGGAPTADRASRDTPPLPPFGSYSGDGPHASRLRWRRCRPLSRDGGAPRARVSGRKGQHGASCHHQSERHSGRRVRMAGGAAATAVPTGHAVAFGSGSSSLVLQTSSNIYREYIEAGNGMKINNTRR